MPEVQLEHGETTQDHKSANKAIVRNKFLMFGGFRDSGPPDNITLRVRDPSPRPTAS